MKKKKKKEPPKNRLYAPAHARIIIEKMCNMVGITSDDIDFSDPNWNRVYTWTTEQRDFYERWLVAYAKRHPESILVINKLGRFIPRIKSVRIFINEKGWKIKETN